MTNADGKRALAVRLFRAVAGESDQTVRAFADALFPPKGPIPISGSEAGAAEFMRKYTAGCQPRQRRLVYLLITVTELGPLVFGPRRKRFSRLTQAERQAFIADGYTSRIYMRRVCVLTMRALLTMAYFANEQVLAHIGMRVDADPFGLDSAPAPTVSETRLVGALDDQALDGVA